jgi:hypothetical protein
MELWWNDANTGKLKYSQKNLLHCNFVQHKSYLNWPGKESGSPLGKKVEHAQQIKLVLNTILVYKDLSFALKNKSVYIFGRGQSLNRAEASE